MRENSLKSSNLILAVIGVVVILVFFTFVQLPIGESPVQQPPNEVGDFELISESVEIPFMMDEIGLYHIEIRSLSGFDSSVDMRLLDYPQGIKVEFDSREYRVPIGSSTVAIISFELFDDSAIGKRNITFVGESQKKIHMFNATLNIIGKGTILLGVQDLAFLQQSVTVLKGTTVQWHNQDDVFHTVTSRGNIFDGGLDPQSVFSQKFDEEGLYEYFCRPHPWMTGSIRVISK